MLLIKHFAKEFDEKHMGGKGSVLDHPKAVAKLRKQVSMHQHNAQHPACRGCVHQCWLPMHTGRGALPV